MRRPGALGAARCGRACRAWYPGCFMDRHRARTTWARVGFSSDGGDGLEPGRILLAQLRDLGGDHGLAIGLVGIVAVVTLMIALGRVERRERRELGDDGVLPQPFGGQRLETLPPHPTP